VISVRLIVTAAELPIALGRLQQAFSEVIASAPYPCDGDATHLVIWALCKF
jgi:hypothetical protein